MRILSNTLTYGINLPYLVKHGRVGRINAAEVDSALEALDLAERLVKSGAQDVTIQKFRYGEKYSLGRFKAFFNTVLRG
jgi:hypothetical protein